MIKPSPGLIFTKFIFLKYKPNAELYLASAAKPRGGRRTRRFLRPDVREKAARTRNFQRISRVRQSRVARAEIGERVGAEAFVGVSRHVKNFRRKIEPFCLIEFEAF